LIRSKNGGNRPRRPAQGRFSYKSKLGRMWTKLMSFSRFEEKKWDTVFYIIIVVKLILLH
jgi:hypothetical protein